MEKFDLLSAKYATVIEPEKHEEEREQLRIDGYIPWRRYTVLAKESENYGKTEELWMK